MRKAITSQFEVATVVDGAQGPQGKPATVYSLVPSCTEIVRKKDGSTEPSGDVTCKVIKKTGDSAPEVVTTGFVIETEVDGRHYQSSTVPASYVTTGILYELYIESKLMDSVTVPVVNDGENAAVASVTPDTYSASFESDGTITASVYFDVTFSLKAGTQDVTPSSITARSLPSAVSISGSGSSRRITIGSAARAADMSEPCVFRLTGTYGGKTYTADCTVQIIAAVKGQTGTGQAGHVGRFYYYAGEWSSSRTYYFEKNQAPYVKIVNNDNVSFYMLDFAAHPDIQQSDTTRAVDSEFEPTSHAGGDPWSLMSSEQQYYIAKAFFGDYAQFGSAIINGDYLMSMNGHIGNTNYDNGALFKGSPAYTIFSGDPERKKYELVNLSKTIGTSWTNVSDTYLSLKEGETAILSMTVSNTVTLCITRRYLSTEIPFDISTNSSNTWELGYSEYTFYSGTIYYIRFTAPVEYEYRFRAMRSASGSVTFNMSRLLFEPNWWVDLLTGKMVAARGNFVVRPNGEVDVSNGKFFVSADGNVTMNDAVIKGSLMYHKVMRAIPSASYINLFSGNTAASITLLCDIFLLHGTYSSDVKIQLPPAKFFPGAHIKIINGTYSSSSGNLSGHPSVVTLSVYHSSETEANVEDSSNVSLNSLAVAAPFTSAGVSTMLYYDYYTTLKFDSYTSVELVSQQNWYHSSTSQYYVWMLIDAKE